MHFALPTRNHRSSPFLAASSVPRAYFSRRRPIYALIALVVILILVFGRSSGPSRPSGAPDTVIVLLIDRKQHSGEHVERVIENRRTYAEAHGYGLFVKSTSDYPIGPVSSGWSRIPALRHAMSTFPYTDTFFFLDSNSIIMNPTLSIESHIMTPERLGKLMRRDVPVVPPDSVIKTYRHVPVERIQFVLTQDKDGLDPSAMLVKRGQWAHYLFDAWFDPIFRLYGFQKAEKHALEHIVQWHPTILTKLALVPQNIMNSHPSTGNNDEGAYTDGDFVLNLGNCEAHGRDCEKEWKKWVAKTAVLEE